MVIIGGGFGGLYAAKALRHQPVRVTIIDRRNHHLFQPLLYEVATAALSAADIAEPIRRIFSRDRSINVVLGEAGSIDTATRTVHLAEDSVDYDYLIVATGATHSYFGNDQWAAHAPGLKTLEDAQEIRRRFLMAFEAAEREHDPDAQQHRLTFVIVGAGPTGVELAGTMSEIARRALQRDFRHVDTTSTRVILVEAGDRVLSAYPPKLSERAKRDLERLGVEVRLNQPVTDIDADSVQAGDERIETSNVFWAAGVQASSLGRSLGAETDRSGRVAVEPDLTVPGHHNVFVIGDLAQHTDPETGDATPGIAPAAIQMGRYAARTILDETTKASSPDQRRPFRYRDKGMMATIGRAKAVARVGRFKFGGVIAWLLWAVIHIMFLIGFRNRLIVMLRWAWAYIIFERGARIITGAYSPEFDLESPRADRASARAADRPPQSSLPSER